MTSMMFQETLILLLHATTRGQQSYKSPVWGGVAFPFIPPAPQLLYIKSP